MPKVQMDLFGWVDARDMESRTETVITSDLLGSSLIKYFGHLVGKTWLLTDDWTIRETLTTIHKEYSREHLASVSEQTWTEAWQRFERHYLCVRAAHKGLSWANKGVY